MSVFYLPQETLDIFLALTDLIKDKGTQFKTVIEVQTDNPIIIALAKQLKPKVAKASNAPKIDLKIHKEPIADQPVKICVVCQQPNSRRSKFCSKRCESEFYRKKYKSQKEAEPATDQAYEYQVVGTDMQANDLRYAIKHGKIAEGAQISRKNGQMYQLIGGKLHKQP